MQQMRADLNGEAAAMSLIGASSGRLPVTSTVSKATAVRPMLCSAG